MIYQIKIRNIRRKIETLYFSEVSNVVFDNGWIKLFSEGKLIFAIRESEVIQIRVLSNKEKALIMGGMKGEIS